MNEFILNNIVLIVMQDMIREVLEAVISLRAEVTIVREAVTSLREEVRSELQSFYERMSTLIERSSAHPPPPPPTAFATAPAPASAFTPPPPPPPPSYYSRPLAEKETDTPDGIAQATVDTPAPAVDPPTDMVYFF